MDCNKLIQNINVGCIDPMRTYEPIGWVGSYHGIINQVRTGSRVNFDTRMGFFPVYDRSRKPFNGTNVKSVENEFYTTFTELVQFPMLLNDPYNAAALNVMKRDKVVVILEQTNGDIDFSAKWQVFGLDGGLDLSSAPNDDASDVAWLIQLQREKNPSNVKFLYNVDKANTIAKFTELTRQDVEYIHTLSILGGETTPQKVYLEVDSDKSAKIVLPTGQILSSTAGVVDVNYAGGAGDMSLVVPKNTSKINQTNGGDTLKGAYSGDLLISGTYDSIKFTNSEIKSIVANNVTSILAYINNNMLSISSANALVLNASLSHKLSAVDVPKAVNINLAGCALPLANIKSILDNAYTLWLDDNTIVVNINLSGGTNAAIDLNDESIIHDGILYSLIYDDLSDNGTVTLNLV